MPLPRLPTIPGREVAGTVDRLGPGVDQDWLGRRVVAHLGPVPGGYAEQAVTKIDNLIRNPDPLSATDAVALVGTGRTARGVLSEAAIGADDVVLIPAAAGGLGWLMVQSALRAGATVIAAAGGATKIKSLKRLNPDLVLDYGEPGWADAIATPPTVVLDGVGGEIGRTALERLAPGGRMIMFGYSSGSPTWLTTEDLLGGSISASWALGPRMAGRPGGIRALAEEAIELGGRGEWRPLTTSYPLAEAARAHRALEERQTLGKVVLVN